MAKGTKIELPIEVADGIVLAVLKEQLGYLKKELKLHEKKGEYMHPEDYQKSKVELIPALNTIIKYFGG